MPPSPLPNTRWKDELIVKLEKERIDEHLFKMVSLS
jgi:hypothetical protein